MAELNEEGQSSIEQEIFRRAFKRGIPRYEVNKVFERKLKIAEGLFQNITKKALLQYAEYSVWVHFFEHEPFPGKIDLPNAPAPSSSPSSVPSVLNEKQIVKLSSETRGSARMDMLFSGRIDHRKARDGARDDHAWVHDKYRSTHKETPLPEGDYYRPNRLYAETDSYETAPRDDRHYNLYRDTQPLIEEQRYARLRRGGMESAMSVPFPRAEPRSTPIPRNSSGNFPTERTTNALVFERANNISPQKPVGHRRASFLRSPTPPATARLTRTSAFATGANSFQGKQPVILPPNDLALPKKPPLDLSTQTAKFQEDFLKKKVLGLGYERYQFFRYLEDARKQANEEHGACSKEIKHYLANSAVWKRFVNEDYPASAPNGHTKHCLRHIDPDQGLKMARKRPSTCLPSVHSLDRSSSRDFRSSEYKSPIVKSPVRASAKAPVKSSATSEVSSSRVARSSKSMALVKAPLNPPTKAPPKTPAKVPAEASVNSSADTNSPKPIASTASNYVSVSQPVPEKNQTDSKSTHTKPPKAYLIIQGKLLPCSLDDIKNVSFAWLTDASRDIVERSLDCKFYAIQRTPDSGLRLSAVRAEGYSSSIVEDDGAQFLNKWVSKVLEGEPIQMSTYWTQYASEHGFMDLTMGTNCGPPSSPAPIKAATGANTMPVFSRVRATAASILGESEDLEDEYESEVEIYCGEPSVSTWGKKRKGDSDGYSQVEKRYRAGSF